MSELKQETVAVQKSKCSPESVFLTFYIQTINLLFSNH